MFILQIIFFSFLVIIPLLFENKRMRNEIDKFFKNTFSNTPILKHWNIENISTLFRGYIMLFGLLGLTILIL